jgi:amino acid transporter
LAFAIVIGYVVVGMNNGSVVPPAPKPSNGFTGLSPVLGIFASIPSIFFAFDGFYATAGIQSEMKEPKKVSKAMMVGLLIVSTISILISVSLLISSGTGKFGGLEQ